MKKLLFILFLFCSVLQAQTTWYISPSGNDVSGAGTSGNPWRSLYKATHTVPSILGDPGDIIHVNAGTYTEVSQSELEPDISIEGEGYNSYILSTYQSTGTYGGVIFLSGGTNTAQHISNIRLGGSNLTGYRGISVYSRSNVDIYNCVIFDFRDEGVRFGTGSNNSFYSNTLTNCSGQVIDAVGNIYIGGQTNMEVYGNTIIQTARAASANGNCISGYEGSFGLKIYNNVITATPYLNDNIWKFAVEIWLQRGLEMYGNTIQGEVDMGKDVNYGAYSYGLSFHDNIVGWDALQSGETNGLQLEQAAQGVYIYRNTFKNMSDPVHFCQYKYTDDFVEDIYIYSNKIYNVGISGATSGWGIRFENGSNEAGCSPPQYYDNINIWNNTIVSHTTYKGSYGILLPTEANTGSVTNIIIKNNIIQGFNSYAIYAYRQDNDYSQAIAGLNISYNDFYGNGNNSAAFSGFTPTYYTSTQNITTTPLFTSDYHLQYGSGNIWTGTVIGSPVLVDFAGTSWHSPPSIGCYEYSTGGAVIATVTTTAITDIITTTATSGGNVTSDGGALVTARGVCWSTGHNPTTASTKTTNGTGTGVFTSAIMGLTEGLTYYVRAYATNSIGTAYGSELSFVADETKGGVWGLLKLSGKFIKYSGKLIYTE